MDLVKVGKIALWSAFGTMLAVLFVFGLVWGVPLGMLLAALALICGGGLVVGALIALSFAEEDSAAEH